VLCIRGCKKKKRSSATHVHDVDARADWGLGWRTNEGGNLVTLSALWPRFFESIELTAPVGLVLRYSHGRLPFSSNTTSIWIIWVCALGCAAFAISMQNVAAKLAKECGWWYSKNDRCLIFAGKGIGSGYCCRPILLVAMMFCRTKSDWHLLDETPTGQMRKLRYLRGSVFPWLGEVANTAKAILSSENGSYSHYLKSSLENPMQRYVYYQFSFL
jgi:hypothetical protein